MIYLEVEIKKFLIRKVYFLFQFSVNQIKAEDKKDKKFQKNNTKFYKKIKMKTWTEVNRTCLKMIKLMNRLYYIEKIQEENKEKSIDFLSQLIFLIKKMKIIQSTNSFYQFSKEYQTYFKDKSIEQIEKPQNPVALMNSFLRNSSFAKKSAQPLDWPSDLDLSNIREEYFIINPNERFQREWNEKKIFFKNRQSPLRTESFNRFRENIRSFSKTYKIQKDNLQYDQIGAVPSQRKQELQTIVQAQKQYKDKKEQFHFLNKQHRLIENLHHDDIIQKSIIENYQINDNKNETNYQENRIIVKMNSDNEINGDWARKRKSPVNKLDTFHRVISQEDNEKSKLGKAKPNRVKQFERKGREYNIVNFACN
ncbi:unnamed protein product [Paramecium sonneborni]|uniref:Uncharacterized protein n=1 Tax=Paramecium sonneborni TaxID=65129 RepID=A0A8S1NM86_9CILI|nr:unnamed protein product [Paramecium sonneborni]